MTGLFCLAPRSGRWINQLVIIPVPYNPLLFPNNKSKNKIKEPRKDLLTHNWYQKTLKYQQMPDRGVIKIIRNLPKRRRNENASTKISAFGIVLDLRASS